ncbi:MAG: DUF697 domain-containing protein [Bacteroidota bacterium]
MNKTVAADSIIRNHVLFAAGGGLIPIPFLDLATVTAIQLDMLKQLSELYEVTYNRSSGKLHLSALASSVLARLGASAIKAIPGLGSLIGGVSMAIMSGASTYAIGQVFVRHYEGGGSLNDFDPEAYRDQYESELEEGKAKTKEWKAEDEAAKKSPQKQDSQADKLAKLKELGELKEAGVLTDKEFKEMKKKILEEF